MSLINQMLRDLQDRQGGKPAPPPERPPRRSRRARRGFSPADALSSIPPVLWVGVGGLAGLALIWGGFNWLSGSVGPGAPVPVTAPPQELVAIANAPAAGAGEAAPKRRGPPVPLEVPPPPPPLAYGASAPAAPVAVAPVAAPVFLPEPVPEAAPPVTLRNPPAYYSDQPQLATPARPTATTPRSAAGAAAAAPALPRVPGVAASPPGHLHPDLLPGAVTATNLALQKAAREAVAAPPPVVTPYGQAEAAYREGRKAYAANRPESSVAALRQALGHYPGHLPARELLADQLELAGHGDDAYALLKDGLAIAPDYTPFRKRAARILLDRGDAAGAVRTLTGAGLPRVEDDPELHLLLAGIYRKLGENFLAAQTYRNLLVYGPREGAYWVGLGDTLAADGQPLEARKAYRRALALGGLGREEAERAKMGAAPL